MTVEGSGTPARTDRPEGLLTLDLVVAPRWLREHRRAERRAARPDALVAEAARRVASLGGPGRTRRFQEILREQGVSPITDWSTFGEPLPEEEWERFFAAITEAKGR